MIQAIIMLMVVSCNEPETIVTNFVHTDGSVTRVIEMESIADKTEDRFQFSDLQVPFDSTWTVKDSTELSEEGDTVWIRRAEKLFKNADEINSLYKVDSGANKGASRHAGFKKRFRWFNTGFRFSEIIDKKMRFGYPVKEFLNDEELLYFYSPATLKSEKENGPDSLKYRVLSDSVRRKTDRWTMKNLVSEWIGEFAKITEGKEGKEITREYLMAREDDLVNLVELNSEKFDSLLKNGILLKEFLGDVNGLKYKTEADSAISIVTNNIWMDFKDYSVRTVMPGKVTGTNGFINASEVLLWPVKSDFFMTEPYEMWAESKVPNKWAWIVSVLFLTFVITGIILRKIKKG